MGDLYKKIDNFCNLIYKYFINFISKYGYILLGALLFSLAMYIRYSSLDFVSHDLKTFIFHWYENFYSFGAKALGFSIGDYTPAYMYILWFISLFKIEPGSLELVHAIKYFSLFFELITGVFIFLILKRLSKSNLIATIGSCLYLYIPTIILNSGYWGQCDSIYVSFIVMALYFLLINKQRTAYIMLGFSFAFKLQAIFIVPLFIVLFLSNKVKLRYVIYVPLVYILMALPSVIMGRDFMEIMSIYFNQATNSYKQLTLNCPTLWAIFFPNFKEYEIISKVAVALTIALIGTVGFLMYKKQVKMNDDNLIVIAYFFSLLVPFLMPHMHERYFYLMDAICIIYMFIRPKKFYLPLITMITSLSGYLLYLFGSPMFIDSDLTLRVCAILNLVVIIVLGKEIFTNKLESSIVNKA